MSEESDNKSPKRETNRIDLTQFEGHTSDLLAELKRCYEEIDEKQRLLELHQDFVFGLRPYIGGNAFDEVRYAYKEAMVNAGFLWKCPDCGATYEDEQTCEYCGYASE